ncbi:MAG: hypothetical protein LBM27_03680 [Lactobacillaceae bacterium]|jgi:hypothetical protein|nr:hypothetical protein [Lactobacillaceae bacterium]
MIDTNLITLKTAILRTGLSVVVGFLLWRIIFFQQKDFGFTSLVIILEAALLIWFRKSTGTSPLKLSRVNKYGLSLKEDQNTPHNDEREWVNIQKAELFTSKVDKLWFIVLVLMVIFEGALMQVLSKALIFNSLIVYLSLGQLVKAWVYYFSYKYFDKN